MASHSKSKVRSFERIEPVVVEPVLETYTPEVTIEVLVQSIYPAHLKYIGTVSGKGYEWMKSGDIVSVIKEDVQSLLDKRIGGTGCCGAYRPDGTRLFELV